MINASRHAFGILRGVPGYIRSDNGPEFVARAEIIRKGVRSPQPLPGPLPNSREANKAVDGSHLPARVCVNDAQRD